MAAGPAETSNKSKKINFFSTVFVLFFISKLYFKKFKQFSLGDLLLNISVKFHLNNKEESQ